MNSMPPLYILRHGETEWNASGRLQGNYDSALTAKGIAQARAQNQILLAQNLKEIRAISSPQGRAYQTAVIALDGLAEKIMVDVALREIGLGAWAGKNRSELIAFHSAKDGFDLYDMAPDGEGLAALYQRCFEFLSLISDTCVIVTHGITSRMLRLILTGQSISALREISGGQGVVYKVENQEQKLLKLGA